MQRPTVDIHAERRIELEDARFSYLSGLMAHAPHDGRPTASRLQDGTPMPSSVNGKETRASERWKATGWVRKLHHDHDVNPCRVSKDGGETWTTYDPPVRERSYKPRTSTPVGASGMSYETLLSIAGAIGDVD